MSVVQVWNIGDLQIAWKMPHRPWSFMRLHPGWQFRWRGIQVIYFGKETNGEG